MIPRFNIEMTSRTYTESDLTTINTTVLEPRPCRNCGEGGRRSLHEAVFCDGSRARFEHRTGCQSDESDDEILSYEEYVDTRICRCTNEDLEYDPVEWTDYDDRGYHCESCHRCDLPAMCRCVTEFDIEFDENYDEYQRCGECLRLMRCRCVRPVELECGICGDCGYVQPTENVVQPV